MPSPSTGPLDARAQAIAAATQLTSIAGPWTVGDVQMGTYRNLWQGSTNDLSGEGTADRLKKGELIVWRIDLKGPGGLEQLYIDSVTWQLVDSITQGH
ncbi:MAG: hypothetical protein ABI573_06765 [Chloroflexota bacterium]